MAKTPKIRDLAAGASAAPSIQHPLAGQKMTGAEMIVHGMTTMLVGVKPGDPATFVAMGTVFVIIAGVASWLPARRAAGLAPTTALREG